MTRMTGLILSISLVASITGLAQSVYKLFSLLKLKELMI